MIFRKVEWVLSRTYMWDMIVCGKVCFSVVLTSKLLSCDRSQFSLLNEGPGEEIYDNWVSFGGSVFRRIRSIPAFAIFQVPSPPNNPYGQKCTCYGGRFCHSSRTSRLVHRLLMLSCQDHPVQGLFFSLQTKLLNIPKVDWTNSRDSFNHYFIK